MAKVKAKIKAIKAREILNSSGRPTLEVKVVADNGLNASVAYAFDNYQAPFAAVDKFDCDDKRFKGFGCLNSVEIIKKQVEPALLNFDIFAQIKIDDKLKELNGDDGNILGPAIIFCVSLACAKLAALISGQELFLYINEIYNLDKINKNNLPLPIFNIFNGGDTGDTNLDFQEFLLIPKKNRVTEMIRNGSEVFLELAEVLEESGFDTDTGQEGGYAPEIDSSIEAIEFILSAIIRRGYEPGLDFNLGIDIGSSVLYDKDEDKYIFSFDKNYFSSLNLISLYEEWLSRYPIIYLEDSFSEIDWSSWQVLTARLGDKLLIAADDMISSNVNRLRESLNKNALNTVVLKPAKAGTLTDCFNYVKLAQEHNYQIVVSGLNQENNDSLIADLAVAFKAQYFKAGSLARGERTVKYNRLMEIEENL